MKPDQPGVQLHSDQAELSSSHVDCSFLLDRGFTQGLARQALQLLAIKLLFALIPLGSIVDHGIRAGLTLTCIHVDLQPRKYRLPEFWALVLHHNDEAFGRLDPNHVVGRDPVPFKDSS